MFATVPSPPPAHAAALVIVHDRRGDSRSGVPGNDIVRATASLSDGRFRFTITNVRIPAGLSPPAIEFVHGGAGTNGGPQLDINGHRHRIHRRVSGTTVVYTFKRSLFGRIDERYLKWRAAIIEGPPSDLAPDSGYALLKVR